MLPGEKLPAKSKPSRHDDNTRLIRETKKAITQAERDIAGHEARMQEIDVELCQPETMKDSQKVRSLMIERADIERSLKELYTYWEEESLKLENLKE